MTPTKRQREVLEKMREGWGLTNELLGAALFLDCKELYVHPATFRCLVRDGYVIPESEGYNFGIHIITPKGREVLNEKP